MAACIVALQYQINRKNTSFTVLAVLNIELFEKLHNQLNQTSAKRKHNGLKTLNLQSRTLD